MEEKIVIVKIIGCIIGVLLLVAGLYYLKQNKEDAESKKIYGVVCILGVIVAAVCLLLILI